MPILFGRLVNHISKNYTFPINIVDYKGGVMDTMLMSNKKVKLIEFVDGRSTEISANTTMIMQSILPNSVRPEIKINPRTKIAFWTLFHYNLVPHFMPFPGLRYIHVKSGIFNKIDSLVKKRYYKKVSEFVRELHEKSSIFFMDYSTFEITDKYLNLNISKPIILPICVDTVSKHKKGDRKHINSDLNICWIGRIEDFKTSILQFSIKKILSYAQKYKRKIKFSLIGYGQDLKKITNIKYNSDFFKLNYIGIVSNKDLDGYLIKEVDLLMAMGTAALEGAKLGIPTILLDASYDTIPDGYKFKWLYESDGSNVAKFIKNNETNFEGFSIDEIIYQMDNYNDNLGVKCFNYVCNNHSTDVIASKLINTIKESDFEWGAINKKLASKSTIRKLYDRYRYKE